MFFFVFLEIYFSFFVLFNDQQATKQDLILTLQITVLFQITNDNINRFGN